MQTQIVVLESVEGKFGRQLKDKSGYLSFGKFYSGEKEFPTGTTLNVELYVTEKGSRYINKAEVVEGVLASNIPTKRGRKPNKALAGEVEVTLPFTPKLGSTSSKDVDWDGISRGKTASLFVASLLQNPNVVQQLDGVDVDAMEVLVWELVDVVFRTRKEKV